MGFLDNLENDLKNLESQGAAAEDVRREREQQEGERARARAAAPFAEKLKSGAFTTGLLQHVTRLGHAQRIKVHMAWMGSTLRLEARERRLELRPGAEGVTAVFVEGREEVRKLAVDLDGSPEALAREWLKA